MEIAIPLIALGGMYIASNQPNQSNSNTSTKNNKSNKPPREEFNNMGIRTNLQTSGSKLPNTNIPPTNYPIMNNNELIDTVQNYPNPNQATDKYLNQNLYEQRERAGLPMSNQIQDIYSLTGNYVNQKDFVHNNMVPFTGPKPRGQIYNNNNAETILDNYIGSGSQTIKKIEQAPLFKPQDNVQWTYGAPNMSDFYQSRQNPVNKMNDVKPFESIHVGPGLNQGYSSQGSNGFNAGMEARNAWLPKTVDELRTANNPKQEYDLNGLQGPAQSVIKNVGIEGKMEKYRPDTFFINTQDRWLTTTGAERMGQLLPEQIVKPSARNETTTFQHGVANAAIKTAGYAPKTFEETKRNQLDAYDVGHSTATGTAPHHLDKDNYHKSHTNYNNNRSTTQQDDTSIFGSGFSSAIGAVIAPIMDILRPNRKEEYVCNNHIYGNVGGEVPSSYVTTQGDIPNTTIKETTLYRPDSYIGNQSANAYLVSKQQAIQNQRDTTTINCQLAPAGSKYGERQYDADYRQTNNESKEKSIVSRTNQGNTSLFNPQMNISIARQDSDRNNNRMWAPQATLATGPTIQTHGNLSYPQQYDQQTNMDRIAPDLLNAFKQNPYTHSLTNIP